MWDSELSNEANGCDAVSANNEGGARLVIVGEPGEGDGHNRGEEIDGDCQELSICSGVTEAVYYSGYCGCETIAGVSGM